LNPTLTTVQLPIIKAGKQAIELLIAQMTDEYATSVQKTLSCPLIVRESSGPPPDSEE
jgi:LacI family transcriptional regulator